MKKIDLNFFPGWTRKSVTFTIDDGNVTMDRRFINIVKPGGIVGTFNLCDTSKMTPEEYREFYRGYEIANHCKRHPLPMLDGRTYVVSDEPFDRETSREYTADDPVIHPTELDGVYMIHRNPKRPRPDGWYRVVDTEKSISLVDEGLAELESVFGKGNVKGFVWPYGGQDNAAVQAYLAANYNSVRRTGARCDSEGYALPADRANWSYTAHNRNMLEEMEKFEAYPDDGELKFFSFGVHSVDFENSGNWCDLVTFTEKYGNRPEDYYYATVSDIFEHEDAVKSAVITDTEIKNPSERTLYATVDGRRVTIPPHFTYPLV